ncbi:MAG: tRNA dihydrouridine synthase DusB [Lachnospiraceae bacterium]|nr:tRNA dihydrouridine synthase DusB [Lachnospiraceae bacterium]
MTIDPLRIGEVELPVPLILGPMAGVTGSAFRLLCREQGAGLVCGEMISAKAIVYRNKKTAGLCRTRSAEHPVSLQLFGSQPEVMAQAAAMLEESWDYDLLDINMGCPVPKIVKNGEGSALMRDPEKIERIVNAVVRATHRPVTVKLRKGFAHGENSAVNCARAAEAGGASMVAVHGRTREQYYSGKADWDCIRSVKEALTIPVIGSGDVTDGPSCADMIDKTGCDGVMIARAAEGNPWIFSEILAYLRDGTVPPRPDPRAVRDMILRHAGLLAEDEGEYLAMCQMRRHAAFYVKGWPGAVAIRRKLSEIRTLEDLESLLAPLEMTGADGDDKVFDSTR